MHDPGMHDETNISFPRVSLVLGGARSGKSLYAERLTLAPSGAATYVATCPPADAQNVLSTDDEMALRIAEHRARRGGQWRTVEEPLDLAGLLRRIARPERPVLVDCLTLWLSNLMMAERDVAAETSALIESLQDLPGRIVFVSTEVGLGIVPDNALARAFRDHAGRLHQIVAAAADHVAFVAAGLPLTLKGHDISLDTP